ncbi:MAG: MarR family transcriptional regulator [Firmicutes bacterium]|nr:MarR family transcriptional regulator [Bacillota bacterium]
MARPSREVKEQEAFLMAVAGKILRMSKYYKVAINRYVEKNNIQKSQHQLLITLSGMIDQGLTVSQRDLAQQMNVTPAAVAVTLKKLEKSGIIEKCVSEKDNRFNEVAITEKGMKIVKESQKVFRTIDTAAFEGFSKEELDQLVSYIDRIHVNMESFLDE